MAWIQIGQVGKTGRVGDLMAFDGGYLGWEPEGDEGYPVAWQSTDGLTWARSDLTKPIRPCPGYTLRPDGEVTSGATNGREILLVGYEYDPDARVCGNWQATAWLSSDGRSWQRAEGFAATGTDINAYATGVWPTPEGWEAALAGPGGFTDIWQSGDGLHWAKVADMKEDDQLGFSSYVSDAKGTRVIVSFDGGNGAQHLLVSQDGRDWREATGFPPRLNGITRVVAPDAAFPEWIAVTMDPERRSSTVWVSPDLEKWRSAPFPMRSIGDLEHTPFGLVALGIDPCEDVGGPCVVEPPRYFLSTDGSAWTALDARVEAEQFIDGAAGVLGVGQAQEGEPQPVWRLERYSDEEAFLFAGLRPDARSACAPRRVDLPAHAIAGVECSPDGDVVDRIGVFLFMAEDELLETYFARLADYGVEPRSGSCPPGPGEIAYVPGDLGSTIAPHRYGCFLNEFGNANYRFTAPYSLVYAGILGTGKDMAALHEWAWLGVGVDEIPGSPTVWRQPSP